MSVVQVYKDAYRVTKSKFFFPPEQFDLTSEEPRPFIHCLNFIYAHKFYARKQVKNNYSTVDIHLKGALGKSASVAAPQVVSQKAIIIPRLTTALNPKLLSD